MSHYTWSGVNKPQLSWMFAVLVSFLLYKPACNVIVNILPTFSSVCVYVWVCVCVWVWVSVWVWKSVTLRSQIILTFRRTVTNICQSLLDQLKIANKARLLSIVFDLYISRNRRTRQLRIRKAELLKGKETNTENDYSVSGSLVNISQSRGETKLYIYTILFFFVLCTYINLFHDTNKTWVKSFYHIFDCIYLFLFPVIETWQ